MPRTSAGILLWRNEPDGVRVLLVHPGGPFWIKKDLGAWSVPKGEYEAHEDALAVARREFAEEVGGLPEGKVIALGDVKQKGGKVVTCFAVQGDFDVAALRSNTFEIEWPPRSGKRQTFPEVDRAGWFSLSEARERINPAQAVFLERLAAAISR